MEGLCCNRPQQAWIADANWFRDWESRRIDYRQSISTTTQALIEEIKTAPESVQREVFDFLMFLKSRLNAHTEGGENLLPLAHIASPPTGNTPEEEAAWHDM